MTDGPKHIAVILHAGKTFDGGRRLLRKTLREAGHEPLWYEVPKSKKSPAAIRHALGKGADLIFVWGGDGMVQRSLDAMVALGTDVPLAILPAGTGNLLANNLEIPITIAGSVEVGLAGARVKLDVGVINGERFAVMAGTGADAITMRDTTKTAKKKVGRLAYFRSGMHALQSAPVAMKVRVDGKPWFEGEASCVLVGNVGAITGGIEVFPRASPVDGKLELAVVTAATTVQWARVLARVATGKPGKSPFVRTRRGEKIVVKLPSKQPYELDGGDRKPTKKLTIRVEPQALTICVPKGHAPKKRR